MNSKMKAKKLKLVGLLLAGLFTLASSCTSSDDDDAKESSVWEVPPVTYRIEVVGEDGQDLLSPSSDENLLESLRVVYDGESYKPDTLESYATRAILSSFHGLKLCKRRNSDYYYLAFGDFEVKGKTEFSLVFDQGNEVVLACEAQIVKRDNRPKADLHFYYQGSEVSLEDNFYRFRLNQDGTVELLY